MASKNKSKKNKPQVSAPSPSEVDTTKPGDPSTPAPNALNMPPRLTEDERAGKDVSRAAVVEPTAVDALEEDGEKIRTERVIATRKGYYGHKLREPGEVFDMSFKGKKGFLPSWVRLAEDEEVPTRRVETKHGKTKEVEVLNNDKPLTEGGNAAQDSTRTVI